MAKEAEVKKVDEPTNATTEKRVEAHDAHRAHKPWVLALIIASVLLVLIVLGGAVGMMLRGASRYDDYARRDGYMNDRFDHGGMNRGGIDMGVGMDGAIDSNVTRLTGVVTIVDGNTLTVAGNGKTTKVTVSDATIYRGASKPVAVNDTVGVLGNKTSDGSVAASQIAISRQ